MLGTLFKGKNSKKLTLGIIYRQSRRRKKELDLTKSDQTVNPEERGGTRETERRDKDNRKNEQDLRKVGF